MMSESATEPLLRVSGLVVGFGEHKVLDGVSIDIHPGQITCVVGPSGCGKTTLLKTSVGLVDPWYGRVHLFGVDITQVPYEDVERALLNVGVLFQNGALINSLTVAENVAIPLEQHSGLPAELRDRVVARKLKDVGMLYAQNSYPPSLSGGMRKRASLARAVALDPRLLFFDEPSAGLDPPRVAELDRLFLRLRKDLDASFVIVTHDVDSVRRIADRIIFLDQGRVIFDGSLDQIDTDAPDLVREFLDPDAVHDTTRTEGTRKTEETEA